MANKADILIIGEGTYPYIRGGVSAWIHQLVTGLKDFRFGIVFIGSRRKDYGKPHYELPENVVFYREIFLFDDREKPTPRFIKGNKKAFERIEFLHQYFRNPTPNPPPYIWDLEFYLKEIDEKQFLYGYQSWEYITKIYNENYPHVAFIDYFWTIRNLHYPIWQIIKAVKDLLNAAKVIHSPSTGYAGFMGSLIKQNTGKPFILTEHGIYVRERKIDIMISDWFTYKEPKLYKLPYERDPVKDIWVKFFFSIGNLCYQSADKIVSLFRGAQRIQIEYGAPPEKCMVIPNGINVKRYEKAYTSRPEEIPKVISLIGRVAPIKDVKTFIRAVSIVKKYIPDIEGWVVGPTDEDPDYYKECVELVKLLNLEDTVKFLGFQDVRDILPKTGVMVLTSISEGLPLVVLEAFAAGVPVVATDVGSCRELIEGGLDERDKQIGKAGFVTPVADASATAKACIRLLTERDLWKQCSMAARKRVLTYYTEEIFLNNYRKLYEWGLKNWRASALSSERS